MRELQRIFERRLSKALTEVQPAEKPAEAQGETEAQEQTEAHKPAETEAHERPKSRLRSGEAHQHIKETVVGASPHGVKLQSVAMCDGAPRPAHGPPSSPGPPPS